MDLKSRSWAPQSAPAILTNINAKLSETRQHAEATDGSSDKKTLSISHIAGQNVKQMGVSSESITRFPPASASKATSSLDDLLRSIKSMNFPFPPGPGNANQHQNSPIPPGQLRDLFFPILMKNVCSRTGSDNLPISKVESGLREALTDQVCASLAGKLNAIRREMQVGDRSTRDMASHLRQNVSGVPAISATSSSSSHPPLPLSTSVFTKDSNLNAAPVLRPPSAPLAMRQNRTELTNYRSMDSASFACGSGTTATDYSGFPTDFQPSANGTPVAGAEIFKIRAHLDPVESSQPNGISIPLDPKFFASGPIRPMKMESPAPPKKLKLANRSRSPRGHSPLVNSRYSPPRPSRYRSSSPSKRRLSHSFRRRSRSRSRSRARAYHSPAKRRRRSSSRPCSPAPPDSLGSQRRGSPSATREYLPFIHHRQPRSPYRGRTSFHAEKDISTRSSDHRRASFHAHKDRSEHRSWEEPPVLRKTPVHMRSIDRTNTSSSTQKASAINQRSPISRPRDITPYAGRGSRRSPSPRRHSISDRHILHPSRSPPPAKYQRRTPSLSRSQSPSRERVSFRRRLSCPPDENHPGLLELRRLVPQPPPHITHRDSISGGGETPASNYDKTKPLTPAKAVKRELDEEDFAVAVALHSLPTPGDAMSAPPHGVISPGSVSPPADKLLEDCPSPGLVDTVILAPGPASTHASPEPRSLIIADVIQPAKRPPSPRPLPTPPAATSPPLALTTSPSASQLLPSPLSNSSTSPTSPTPPSPALPPKSPSLESEESITTPAPPSHNIPGLWLTKTGHDQADVVDCEFEVGVDIAQKWHLSSESLTREPDLTTSERLSLRLLCLQNGCQTDSLPEAASLMSVQPAWPEQGSLVVQMNPSKPYRQSWLPEDMGPSSPGLDITESVREGTNVLRLIQLDDMTDKIFLLHTVLLPQTPPQECLLSGWDDEAHNTSAQLWV